MLMLFVISIHACGSYRLSRIVNMYMFVNVVKEGNKVNVRSLFPQLTNDVLLTLGEGYGPNVMFSNGECIGHVAAAKDVSLTLLIKTVHLKLVGLEH